MGIGGGLFAAMSSERCTGKARQYIGAYRLPTVGDRRAGNRRYNGNVSGEDRESAGQNQSGQWILVGRGADAAGRQ